MRRMIAARAVAPQAVIAALPGPSRPGPFPEDGAEQRAAAHLAGAEEAAHQGAGFEDAAVPLAFQKDRAPVDRLRSEPAQMVELALTEYKRLRHGFEGEGNTRC